MIGSAILAQFPGESPSRRSIRYKPAMRNRIGLVGLALLLGAGIVNAQRTSKPVLHGKEWVAITGKPLAATAGAMTFVKGGNAVDAACAMLGATSTMWDTLGWGGETQALIYNPHTKKVIGINALGVAPTGATAKHFIDQGIPFPPQYGPEAAVTPGTPGGLMVMLAEYGTLSLADVLEPAIQMADGYPIEAQQANNIERQKAWIKQWPYSKAVLPAAPGRDTRRGAPPGRDLPSAGPAGDPAQAGRGRARRAGAGKRPQGGDLRRLRPLLPRRHRRGVRPRHAGAGRPDHAGGSRPLAGPHRGAGQDRLQGHRGLQAHPHGSRGR